MIQGNSSRMGLDLTAMRSGVSRKLVVAMILGVALVAFEIFNFDTTQYALRDVLGDVRFAGVMWASILAIAFCAIDFAGLVRIFTPERGRDEPRVVWFLTGAWLLGTIANAIMTWWAVSLTLLNHEFGNEVLSREELLRYVPIFVAMLVWLTRILFIGAFSVAGEGVVDRRRAPKARVSGKSTSGGGAQPKPAPIPAATARPATSRPASASRQPPPAKPAKPAMAAAPAVTYEPIEEAIVSPSGGTGPVTDPRSSATTNSRIRQRPPVPGSQSGRTPSGNYARTNTGH